MGALEQGAVDVIVQIPADFERDMTVAMPERISITAIAELWPAFVALGIFAIVFNTLAALTYKKQA